MKGEQAGISDKPFVKEEVYDVDIEKVWQALTDEKALRDWYFPQLIRFKPIVGFKFEFSNDGSSYQKEWQVTRIEDGKLLSHSWIYKGYPGTSEVTFELFKEGSKTRLRLTHTGLGSFPSDPHFARQRFIDGWNRIIGINLKHFLTGDS